MERHKGADQWGNQDPAAAAGVGSGHGVGKEGDGVGEAERRRAGQGRGAEEVGKADEADSTAAAGRRQGERVGGAVTLAATDGIVVAVTAADVVVLEVHEVLSFVFHRHRNRYGPLLQQSKPFVARIPALYPISNCPTKNFKHTHDTKADLFLKLYLTIK